MTDSDRRAPLSLFIPARKFLEHELKLDPDFLKGAIKKGTYPAYVLVKWDVSPEGVRLTVDPWAYMTRRNCIMLVEQVEEERVWQAEREQAVHVAMEEARLEAWKAFPSLKRWRLLRELADTPK